MSHADVFRKKCEELNIDAPDVGNLSVNALAQLIAAQEDLLVPTLYAYPQLTLPIVSEWILGAAGRSQTLKLVSLLATKDPAVAALARAFLETNPVLDYTEADVLMAIIRLLGADHHLFAPYFRGDILGAVASAQTGQIQVLAIAAFGALFELAESELDRWLMKYTGHDSCELEYHVFLKEALRNSTLECLTEPSPVKSELSVDYTSPMLVKIANTFLPKVLKGVQTEVEFVETETSLENLGRVAQALQLARPVLLTGASGSGKTKLVEYVHNSARGGELVRIHLGDQTDAKGLVGSYVSGAVPGKFEWRYGALASAVQQGRWVLIENIDRAPSDVASLLLPLLERGELVLASRNQVITAAPGFQLIGTASSEGIVDLNRVIGARLWNVVPVLAPPVSDLEFFALAALPPGRKDAKKLVSLLVSTLYAVRTSQIQSRSSRVAGVTDLLKLARRIRPAYDADDIFLECVSVFASFTHSKSELASLIADSLGASRQRTEMLLSRRDPKVAILDAELQVGRSRLARRSMALSAARKMDTNLQNSKFALTRPTKRLLEDISVATEHCEPVLLVGETGTGKTAIVQHLAALSRRKLVVVNVSQQVESGDLVGGYKPMDAKQLIAPLLEEFYDIFDSTFSRAKNHEFISVMEKAVKKKNYKAVVRLFRESVKLATRKNDAATDERDGGPAASETSKRKRKRVDSRDNNLDDWVSFDQAVDQFEAKLHALQGPPQFEFVSGMLVRAVEQGNWILLDELNLAPADTIEGIGELISSRCLTVLDAGGKVVHAHPNFRLFANMNPASDVGKRDLPSGVRALFTEIWSPEPDEDVEALRAIVATYLPVGTSEMLLSQCVELFLESRQLARANDISDGAGQRPHFSMRTLSRMLSAACVFAASLGLPRALFEAYQMCFVTLLDGKSALKLTERAKDAFKPPIRPIRDVGSAEQQCVSIGAFRISVGQHQVCPDPQYILTSTVEHNMQALARAASLKSYPILLQGPTSSGKTSMVTHLAMITGHRVVRINNHEHTDLAEYMGGYESTPEGTLVFQEGALVQALRNGDWLILDELNLAPSDVLEALNRLLDDNRELLVPETQEFVRPHRDFLLFATQNPADGTYAGRKALSRAFRSRFLELHFGDIPEAELDIILREKTHIAPSYAKKIVEVYQQLSRAKSVARIFEHPATLRDLFRWAVRIVSSEATSFEGVALAGFALLGERARTVAERELIRQTLSSTLRVEVPERVEQHMQLTREMLATVQSVQPDVVWTSSMVRVLSLTTSAFEHNEAVLLVGETGCGKTTVVQALAAAMSLDLITVNAHQNTETSDLVGSQRPCRMSDVESKQLFEWVDGPLVKAMKSGSIFLLDEISLADDSVLERLNSVLESGRTLFVPEIGTVEAAPGFKFVATMNPGGDYGKKELSPALRNRFTEIWVPPALDREDMLMAVGRVLPTFPFGAQVIVDFSLLVHQRNKNARIAISLRDVLSWANFVKITDKCSIEMVVHGAFMVFIDPVQDEHEKRYLVEQLSALVEYPVEIANTPVALDSNSIRAGPFSLPRHVNRGSDVPFSLEAPTTASNAMRVIRAMQVLKPVLLEGPPGAGKTSLIAALAQMCGNHLARINLSEQTDLADLFGQDAPSSDPGKFVWRNAPFLRAMEEGEWVLLDEMNLAPQQVLEGLNACLDHRGEAYVPELGRTFIKHPNFRVFAAQNPYSQGGGRKGLPKSFLSRFTRVFVRQLDNEDLAIITAHTHPGVPLQTRRSLAAYIDALGTWTSQNAVGGGPFEFNLRDTLRWLDILQSHPDEPVSKFLDIIVLQRFRTVEDRKKAQALFREYLPFDDVSQRPHSLNPLILNPFKFELRGASYLRGARQHVHTLSGSRLTLAASQQSILESMLRCVNHAWPVLLIGSSGSGKTSMIRLLAMLCGARLQEFAVTADLDASDLIGEYDQLDKDAEWFKMWSIIERAVSPTALTDGQLLDAVNRRDLDAVRSAIPSGHPAWNTISDAVDVFESLRLDRPSFTWVDGMLVRAAENGDWLVLDNANLCASSVLDRLNSLLERDGVLSLSECMDENGHPRTVRPHPSFRIFLTVDPSKGELSRAMRNRSVEIWTGDSFMPDTRTVSANLNMSFSRPLTLSRLADLDTQSWLNALVIDAESAKYALAVPSLEKSRLVEFLKYGTNDVAMLRIAWDRWFFTRNLQDLVKRFTNPSEKPSKILEKSVSAMMKPGSVYEFNLYAVVLALIGHLESYPELASILPELFSIEDPSQVTIFRDFLNDFATQNEMIDLKNLISQCLGEYDSSLGTQISKLWSSFGKPLGFKSIVEFSQYERLYKLCDSFDELTSNLSPSHLDDISEIRETLALALTADITEEYMISVESAIGRFGSSLPPREPFSSPVLIHEFRELWYTLSVAQGLDSSLVDVRTLSRLSYFSNLRTVDLVPALRKQLLMQPATRVGVQIENVLLDALKKTALGQGNAELKELFSVVVKCGKAWPQIIQSSAAVKQVANDFVKAVTQVLEPVDVKNSNVPTPDLQDAHNYAIESSEWFLRLYVSDAPRDPALAQHVWYARSVRMRNAAKNDAENWAKIRATFGVEYGRTDSYLEDMIVQCDVERVPDVWRPSNGGHIVADFDHVHRDLVSLRELASNIMRSPRGSLEEIALAQSIAEGLCSRLKNAVKYRDLVFPAVCAAQLLSLGLSLQWHAVRQLSANESQCNVWLLDPIALCSSPRSSMEYPLVALKAMSCSRVIPLKQLEELLGGVYRKWTLERLRLEEKQKEISAGFRYNDDIDSEEAAEREFRRLFPDFDEGYEHTEYEEEDFASELCESYCAVFVPHCVCYKMVPQCLTAAISSIKSIVGISHANHMAAFNLAMKERLSSVELIPSSSFNFYSDPSVPETLASGKFAEKVISTIVRHLELWPEHDTLLTIKAVAEEICALPPGVPLALRLAKVEQLHHYLHEWDRFATKEYKVSELMADASTLVVKWRRVELSTWPALFAVEQRRARRSSSPFWFNLFETLLVTKVQDMLQVAKVLVLFIGESLSGQFEQRLHMLAAFERHLELLNEIPTMQCVRNVRQFYNQFLPHVQDRLHKAERELRGEVVEIAKLASWRDINIHSLKQSAQRSHRNLFKVVKRFRAVLNDRAIPTDFSLNTNPSSSVHSSSQIGTNLGMFPFEPLLSVIAESGRWKGYPTHLHDLNRTITTMRKYADSLQPPFSRRLDELAVEVFDQAEALRKGTPKVWTKETKSLISSLKMEKQQYFSEVLKELRASGLRSSVRKDTLEQQNELISVLASNTAFDDSSAFGRTNESFYAFLELLPRLRASVSEAIANDTVDVSSSDLQRGLALTENTLSWILRLRRVAARHELYKANRPITPLLHQMAQKPKKVKFDIHIARSTVLDTVHIWKSINALYDALGLVRVDSSASHQFESVNEISETLTVGSDELCVRLKTVAAELENLARDVETKTDGSALFGSIFSSMSDAVSHSYLRLPEVESVAGNDVIGKIVECSSLVLVVVQEAVQLSTEFAQTCNKSEDGRPVEWLTAGLRYAEKLLLILRSNEIWSSLNEAIEMILRLSSTHELEFVAELAGTLSAFVYGYEILSSLIESYFVDALVSTEVGLLKLASVLQILATSGFCSPPPTDSDNEDEDRDSGEKTGLGDGKGDNGSSKDVDEDEDDVAEAMQTSNPDQDERDQAEEDTAKEVENDIAGQLEDYEPKDAEENSDKEESSESDAEDEVGDLDDLDPDAVDEKMWDGQKDADDEKTKNSDDVKGTQDGDLEAQENDNDNSDPAASEDPREEKGDQESEAESDVDQNDAMQSEGKDVQPEAEQKDALDLPEDMQLDEIPENSEDEDMSDLDGNDVDAEEGPDDLDDENVEAESLEQEQTALDKIDDTQDENMDDAHSENDMDAADDGTEENDNPSGPEESENAEEPSEGVEGDADTAPQSGTQGPDASSLEDPHEDAEADPDHEQSTTSQDRSSSRAQGDAGQSQLVEDNLGQGGEVAQDNSPMIPDRRDEVQTEQKTRESLKQLGDALKEYHNRHKEIFDRSDDSNDESDKNMSNNNDPLNGTEDFEHVGAEDAYDTQALGKSSEKVDQTLNEDMAIDDELDQEDRAVAGEDEAGAGAGADTEEMLMPGEEAPEVGEESAPASAYFSGLHSEDCQDQGPEDSETETSTVQTTSVSQADGVELWRQYEGKIYELAMSLGEQLRLILEPTLASKLRGDYKTGKRLNMRRVIPYIASDYRKDKIWMRRTKPAKREYQVLLALDDSKSMAEPAIVELAFQAIALVGNALNTVEVGEMAIARFGETTHIVHPLHAPFNVEAGNEVMRQFTFSQNRTDVHQLLADSLAMFRGSSSASEQWKLEIIISDGISDDHEALRRLVRKANDEHVMLVFVVLDALNTETSILNMNEVKYVTDSSGAMKLEVRRYMDDFPFEYYVIVRNIRDLPSVLAAVLRQYFQAVE